MNISRVVISDLLRNPLHHHQAHSLNNYVFIEAPLPDPGLSSEDKTVNKRRDPCSHRDYVLDREADNKHTNQPIHNNSL